MPNRFTATHSNLAIVELAHLEAQKSIHRMVDTLQSSGFFDTIKRVQAIIAQRAETQERMREMVTLPTLAYRPEVFISPPRPQVVNEDRIARRVSREVIGHFERQKFDPISRPVTLRITTDEIVRNMPDGVKRISLTTRQRALLVALSPEFTTTKRLVPASGYNNQTTLRQAISDLREKIRVVFNLEDLPIYGEEGRGYRIADGFSIVIDR